MTTFTQNEKGFTLVELAIVLVIVGLLIGGILKGQELIANAQVTATINQMTGFDAATSTFRDKYNAFPGDMVNATNRLPNCSTPCATGTGDGKLAADPGAVPTGDSLQYFLHLRADGLVTGFTGNASGTSLVFGEELPSASIGGGYFAGYYNGTNAITGIASGANPRIGHYLTTSADANAAISASNGSFTTQQAARVDNKIDDGDPLTGSVIGSTSCPDSTNGGYLTANQTLACSVFYRIQG